MSLWQTYKDSVFLCRQRLAIQLDFAIISAQNPAGELKNPHVNLCLDKQFEAILHQARLPFRAVVGASADLKFQEKSWIVFCDKLQALQLARKVRQNAIYWVTNNKLFLVPVLYQETEEYLGLFESRVILLAD
ncbi:MULTISPECIES: DUF3293 domain-containing protein [unclassified Arsukibacterium]|uniref:DUF3293 domain-containing protein n=1 Tax=unclassified Arsukibacterium TaxID=2635278 RepID=UPI000C69F31A|nr:MULTISPECIES: DUF3293 domain-containing protein [unclassified Arsukibacterium]MAA95861.1 hypothetical protein [Rheinheimera sp.]MBM34622.1 hypothetical protein [Rheinheimera sp.]HAW94345.1 DUF3293 domain-containing protein [Candidatus Azambacteria bacterium]|tara:strand:- start:171 stop:569 length:399 start_codon:yes stop_codon:yes gene_type:complete